MDEQLTSVNAEQVSDEGSQQTEQVNSTVETVNAENVETATTQQTEKPVQSAEENAKFAAIRREAEAKARDKARDEVIAEMYGESHGIYTYKDYQKAVEKQHEEEKKQKLLEQNLPEEVVEEIIESRKFRENWKAKEQQLKEQERQTKEYDLFLKAYPDVKAEQIPESVWTEFTSGKSLVDAYAKHENNLLKQEIAKYREIEATKQKNAENAQSSTGSVTGQGAANDGYISRDTFEANKHDRSWIIKNFSKISESRKKW